MQTTVGASARRPRIGSTRRRFGRARLEEIVAGYAFMLPSFLLLTVFLILPILSAFVLVFMQYDLLTPPRWAGLSNIKALFSDKRMMICYWNTLRFTLGATFLNNVLGLLLAMAVNRAMPRALKYFLRTALFFPVLTTSASLALVWQFMELLWGHLCS